MSFADITRKTERVLSDNAPAILTGIAVTGTITTAVLVGTASFKAADVLANFEQNDDYELSNKDKFEMVWKLYIPSAAVASSTIAAIVMSNRIGSRRAAAVAAAYSITDRAFTEYKEKVVEKIGENKERAVRDEIAQDRVNAVPPQQLVIAAEGKVLCMDSFSNQPFMSTMEEIRRAENNINKQILHSDYATVDDFYDQLGIPHTSISGEMGWNTDKMLDLDFTSAVTEEGRPCLVVHFAVTPYREPHRFC